MKMHILSMTTLALSSICFFSCNTGESGNTNNGSSVAANRNNYGGFPNEIVWGQHLVNMGGCNDCHTPKVMTPNGPMPDTSMILAGHPANVPPPQIDRKDIESKGLTVTNDLTVWIGPWGISYSANLTPDTITGIGNWTEDQFLRVFREGKFNGAENGRALIPPMNFVAEGFSHAASDDELKAIFAYLKTIKPVHNVVPALVPPVSPGNH